MSSYCPTMTPGRKHVEIVAASLMAVRASVRVLDLPGLGPKGDVVNWAAAGGTAEQLLALVEKGRTAMAQRQG